MGDGTRTARGPDERAGRADGGVHFEETIGLSDSSFAGLSSVTAAIALVSVLGMLLVVPFVFVVFFGVVVVASGISLSGLGGVLVSGPGLFTVLFVVVFGLVVVAGVLLVAGMAVKGGGSKTSLSLGYSDEIHTRVTDSAVEIDREGGYIGQSSGVTIPFETVTSVEYNDPDGDLRMNIGDVRAKKFIGGRSGDWVRIGRSDGPAVYVGSDQHRRLADVVAGLAPHVERAEPFS